MSSNIPTSHADSAVTEQSLNEKKCTLIPLKIIPKANQPSYLISPMGIIETFRQLNQSQLW